MRKYPSLTNQTDLTHMQSFNQIVCSNDKTSGKNRIKKMKKKGDTKPLVDRKL